MPGPRRLASPPAFTPLPYGLLSVAEPAADLADEHWRNGVEFQPDACGPAITTEARCLADGAPKAATSSELGIRAADPFAVYAYINCSPASFRDLDEARARTAAALTNNEAARLEHTFWTGNGGTTAIEPHLAENTAVTVGVAGQSEVLNLQTAATVVATGAPFTEAIGLLEGALAACYGGVGVIHLPRWTLASFGAVVQVFQDGPRLHTLGGTLVAAGAGYPGTGPDGSAPAAGTAWLYATGAVKYWRSGIEFAAGNWGEALGKAKNDTVLIAERTYVIGWDCCHFAVHADVGTFSPPVVT